MLSEKGKSLKGATVVVSGSGNVAIYAAEKATELGAKVVALSDSNGYIYDKNGIDLDAVKQIKEVERKRIKEYLNYHKDAEYHEGCKGVWTIKCDVALPCATQNEIDEESAKILVANGVTAVGEGANIDVYKRQVLCQAKAVSASRLSRDLCRCSQAVPDIKLQFWTRI